MIKENHQKVQEIMHTQSVLSSLDRLIAHCPRIIKTNIFVKDEFGFNVSFRDLDTETRQGLREVIKDYIKKRIEELDEELKGL